MKQTKPACVAILTTALAACGGSGGGGATTPATPTTPTTPTNPTTPTTPASSKTSCPDDITAGVGLGITALPTAAAAQYKNNFCKYTKLDAPNGKPIHFYAQNQVSNEQMVRARNILQFYLTDVPGAQYGADKSAVWNQMADNNATLIMPNGSDTGSAPADGQTLFETENVVEGSAAYLANDPRDAAFEEILHLMHDTGFGVDGANTSPGVLTGTYQAEIRAGTNNAVPSGIVAGGTGLWAATALDWLNELSGENSLTQEYLASVIDTYYGLAGQSSAGGSNDLYTPQTRDQIRTLDPMGWALVGGDSPRKYFSEYVTYTARIDAGFSGTFSLTFDAGTRYTHKSQYLLNAILLGSSNTGLTGNSQANRLTGNSGDNRITGQAGDDIIDGGEGSDTAVFSGASTDYTITTNNGTVTVVDGTPNRDGTDTLTNINLLTFSDTSLTP